MIEYCVFCVSCNSPILIGSVQGSDATLMLAPITLTCQSCDATAPYKGPAYEFSRSGKYAYWGVICACGDFQPVLRGSIDYRERVPNVPKFTTLCRHRQMSPSQHYHQQHFDRSHLRKREYEEELENFQPYPFDR